MKRTFLVTGATKGIGLAVTRQLLSDDQRVIGIARNEDQNFPAELSIIDLNTTTAHKELANIIKNEKIDGIVNNVGIVKPASLLQVDINSLEEVMKVNLHPALLTMQSALPTMLKNKWGRVVNISSLTVLGSIDRTAYAASKAALISFTRSWAIELATTGITVNAVSPGPTATELFRKNNPPGSEGEKRYLNSVPMKRLGKPEEIAATISFLLSDKASYITGQTIYVDGGASIGKLPL